MRIIGLILSPILLLASTVSAPPAPPQPGFTLDGEVIRIIDGDTIVIESRVQYHVRLIDCWCPESRTTDQDEKRRGMASKNRMTELAAGKAVRVNVPLSSDLTQVTTMGRVLGRVWLNVDGVPESRDLSEIMVSEGLATPQKIKKGE